MIEIQFPNDAFLTFRQFYQKHGKRFHELTGIYSNEMFPYSTHLSFHKHEWAKIHAALKMALEKNPQHKDWMVVIISGIESEVF